MQIPTIFAMLPCLAQLTTATQLSPCLSAATITNYTHCPSAFKLGLFAYFEHVPSIVHIISTSPGIHY